TNILTDWLVSWGNQILKVENDSVLLDFLNVLEQSWVQSAFFYIEADPVDLFGNIKFKLMLFDQVDGENKVLYIGSHNTDDKQYLESEFLYSKISLFGVFEDLIQELPCLVDSLISHE